MPSNVFDPAFNTMCVAKEVLNKNIVVEKKDTTKTILDATDEVIGLIDDMVRGVQEMHNKNLSNIKQIANTFKKGATRTTAKSLLKMAEREEVNRIIRDTNKLSQKIPNASSKNLQNAAAKVKVTKSIQDTLNHTPVLAKSLKVVSKISKPLKVVGAVLSANDIATSKKPGQETAKVAGGVAGGIAGAKGGALAGAAWGTFLGGPVGTVVGGVIGGVAGAIGGGKIGEEIGELVYKNNDSIKKYSDKTGQVIKNTVNKVKDIASDTLTKIKNKLK
jgi:uncharacterized membrane protein